MKFCAKCGQQNNDNDKFCNSCGEQFEEQTNPQTQQPTQTYQQMGHATYQQPAMQPKQSAGLGIASMVLGICALLFSCCIPYLPFFLALAAVVMGGICLAKKMGGKGMAIAGLVCGIIALIPSVIVLVGGAIINDVWMDLSGL